MLIPAVTSMDVAIDSVFTRPHRNSDVEACPVRLESPVVVWWSIGCSGWNEQAGRMGPGGGGSSPGKRRSRTPFTSATRIGWRILFQETMAFAHIYQLYIYIYRHPEAVSERCWNDRCVFVLNRSARCWLPSCQQRLVGRLGSWRWACFECCWAFGGACRQRNTAPCGVSFFSQQRFWTKLEWFDSFFSWVNSVQFTPFFPSHLGWWFPIGQHVSFWGWNTSDWLW